METAPVTNGNQNHAHELIHQILDGEAVNPLSNGNGNPHRELAISIKEMVESSYDPPLSSNQCCICRIPVDFRKLNEEAYTPQIISIGPFHHGSKRLEPMEKLKLKHFKRFLQRTDFNVEILVNAIKLNEKSVRDCYAETIELSSDDFTKVILVDGIFLIEFFYAKWSGPKKGIYGENHMLLNPVSWGTIAVDLRLLENQLPFDALEILFRLAYAPSDRLHPSFTSLAIKVFEVHLPYQKFPENLEVQRPIRHFVELTKAFLRPASRNLLSPHESNDPARSVDQLYDGGVKFKLRSCKCLLDLTRYFADFARAFPQLPSSRKPVQSDESNDIFPSPDQLYTATQLYEAGVKFKVSSSKCLLDLKFTNGTFEIPCIHLDNDTETIYRNIIAFEQCHYLLDSHLTDYVVLLNLLINTPKDAELLIRKGIIINGLSNSDAVASLFNSLDTNIIYDGCNSPYRGLFRDLNAFYNNTKHTWKASMKRDYFSTPWKIVSTIAATTLLLLTLVQAICSILQVVKMP